MQIPWLFPIFIFSLTLNKIPWLLPSLEFPWLFPNRWTPWMLEELEQLERLRSEDTPQYPMIIHTID